MMCVQCGFCESKVVRKGLCVWEESGGVGCAGLRELKRSLGLYFIFY